MTSIIVNPSSISETPPEQDFWGESEMEYMMRVQKSVDQMFSLFGIPIKLTTSLNPWEKLLWFLTPTKKQIVYDSSGEKKMLSIILYKKRKDKIYIVSVEMI